MENEKLNLFVAGHLMLFDKPLYWTSFDLVNKIRIIIRNTCGIKKIKVGHAGTLDPLATGLMIVCTGKATKKIEELMVFDKEYVATLYVGKTTPSFDLETETDGEYPVDHITEKKVIATLESFVGEQEQMPPMHSAKYIDGKRAYEFARKGIQKEMKPVKINITKAELIDFSIPEIKVKLRCSKGTYIRSFARDFGLALGSGCYLASLQRSAIGEYTLEKAFTLESFEKFIEELKQNEKLYV